MSFSLGSFVICFLCALGFAVYLHFLVYVRKDIPLIHARFTTVAIGLVLVRMLLPPLHFPFMLTVKSRVLLPFGGFLFERLENFPMEWYVVLFWILGAGACIRLGMLFSAQIRFRRALLPFMVPNAQLPAGMRRILQECGGDRFRISLVPMRMSPLVIGVVRPIIVIPENTYTDDELYYIFRHEIAHYKNGDLWVKALLSLVLCIQWYNIFVYFLSRELNLVEEMVNDQRVISSCDELQRLEYAQCIMKTAKRIGPSSPKVKGAASFAGGKRSALCTRIGFIIGEKDVRPQTIPVCLRHLVLAGVLALSFVVVPGV